jgi:hypothetical protein
VGVFLWVGCKYDFDSVYLGRKKAKFLGHISQADLEAITPYLARGGDVNAWHAPPSSCCHRKSRVLEAPRVAKLMGFMGKREKYEMEDAKKSSGGMVPIEASLY